MPAKHAGPRLYAIFAGALIAIFALQLFFASRTKSPSSDEPPHLASGLGYVATGVFRGNPQHPPLLKDLSGLSMLLGGIRWPRNPLTDKFVQGQPIEDEQPEWAIGDGIIYQNGPDRVMFWARLPFLLTACIGGIALYAWGCKMLGGLAALGAVFLYTLDPVILGQAYMVTFDVPLAAFSVLFLFTLWNYVKQPGKVRLVLCGLALGALLGAKFSAVLLLPVAAVLLLVAKMLPDKVPATAVPPPPAAAISRNAKCPCGSGKKYKACHGRDEVQRAARATPELGKNLLWCGGVFLGMCAVAYVLIQATYLLPRDPLAYVHGLQLVNADHNADHQVFLAGEFGRRFVSYFAAAYLLKEPVAALILTAMGLGVAIRSRAIPALAKWFLLLPPAVLFAGHTMLADNIGIRYIMGVLPFGHLLGGLGLATLLRMSAKWARYGAIALCAWLAVAAAGVYPDHLSYFNEAACLLQQPGLIGIDGGTRCGPLWLDDSNVDWGAGLKQLKAWLDSNAKGRTVRIGSPFVFPAEIYDIPYETVTYGQVAIRPPPGLYAISAHWVARIGAREGPDHWLRATRPAAIVGHAMYVYDLR